MFMISGVGNTILDDAYHQIVNSQGFGFTSFKPDWFSALLIGVGIGLLLAAFWDKIWYRNREYQDGWLHNEVFTIWQAACLWVGQEPKLPITHGAEPYPVLKMIEESVSNQEIDLYFKDDEQQLGWSKVKRGAIAEYARKRNLRPVFPF